MSSQNPQHGRRHAFALFTIAFSVFGFAQPVHAVQFATSEDGVYRLATGDVLDDDLVVFGSNEVYIDGTVNGDVVALANYIEVNGTIHGDAMLAASGIELKGSVTDDLRAAAAGIRLSGTVGDDVFLMVGGGQYGWGLDAMVTPGAWLTDKVVIGGDAYLFGGSCDVASAVKGNMGITTSEAAFTGSAAGDAEFKTGSLAIDEAARVGGTLTYHAAKPMEIPASVCPNIEFKEWERVDVPFSALLFLWLSRSARAVLGLVVFGWILRRFAPGFLPRTVAAIDSNPAKAQIIGLSFLVFFVFPPIATAVLAMALGLFWGLMAALAGTAVVLGLFGVLWILSPLMTGLWLGVIASRRRGETVPESRTLAASVIVATLLCQSPGFGVFISLLSVTLTLGGLVLALYNKPRAAPPDNS